MKAVLAWVGLVTVFLSLCVLFVMFFAPNPDDGTLAPLKSVLIAGAPPPPGAKIVGDCVVLMPQVARVQRLRRSFTIVAGWPTLPAFSVPYKIIAVPHHFAEAAC